MRATCHDNAIIILQFYVLPFTSRSQKLCLPSRFSNNIICVTFSPMHVVCPDIPVISVDVRVTVLGRVQILCINFAGLIAHGPTCLLFYLKSRDIIMYDRFKNCMKFPHN